jgi:hypothetical protein
MAQAFYSLILAGTFLSSFLFCAFLFLPLWEAAPFFSPINVIFRYLILLFLCCSLLLVLAIGSCAFSFWGVVG